MLALQDHHHPHHVVDPVVVVAEMPLVAVDAWSAVAGRVKNAGGHGFGDV